MNTGFVYAIHAVGTNRVKIGHSNDPEGRLLELQTGSPFPLELLHKEVNAKIERSRRCF